MPKITTHHIYGHYCHRGGDRSGKRIAHRAHKSMNSKSAKPDLGGYNMKVVKDSGSSLEALQSNEKKAGMAAGSGYST